MHRWFQQLLGMLRGLRTGEEGQDMTEYALMVALIALMSLFGLSHFASAVNKVFASISSSLA